MVVFPAVESATEIALDVHEGRGADVSAFTQYFEDGDTILYPIVQNSLEINNIMTDAFERIWLTGVDVATELERANAEVNALFE